MQLQEIILLRRLIDPELMAETYELLASVNATDQQIVDFIEAAQRAKIRFPQFRAIQKQAKALLSDVADAAQALAILIRKLRAQGIVLPEPLAQRTQNAKSIFCTSEELGQLQFLRFIEGAILKANEPKPQKLANDIVDELKRIAIAARDCPANLGLTEVDAALCTRQDSAKTSYIRAFAALVAESKLELSPSVKQALALTANVVMDDADFSYTEDDVRKALSRQPRAPASTAPARKTRSPKPT